MWVLTCSSIIATIGPKTNNVPMLHKLRDAGVNISMWKTTN